MRLPLKILLACIVVAAASLVVAQPPPPRGPRGGAGGGRGAGTADQFVARLLTYDTNKDGQISKEEMTDNRLQDLFRRADANQDGSLTKEELTALFAKESADAGGGRGGPGIPGGPGGKRGRGGPGGPPRPGQILPAFLQEELRLTARQVKQLEELQKDVDERLAKILTQEQKDLLRELSERGPGGPPGGRPPERQP